MTPCRHTVAAAALGLALLVGTAACGSDDPAPSGHGSASSSTSASPSSSPTITPAAGVLLDNKYFRGHVPQGWQHWDSSLTTAADAGTESGTYAGSSVGFVAIPSQLLIVDGRVERPIQQQAKSALSAHHHDVRKLVGYPTYGGRRWYHLTGTSSGKRYDFLGRDEIKHTPYTVLIDFTFPTALTAAQRQKVIDSVMTTIRFEK